ncbi:MAG: DUF4338 domain-containing protein [Gammaproteobacteria bacterium]|nr:DUF4338 domain-containing protein [Gammaproteobacteria bacterium]MBU1961659.1 DUF4338 domain-containing protein [Gammaproteobacteria bacterium]
MQSTKTPAFQFCGTPLLEQQIDFIQRTAKQFCGLSRTELAATLCEQLNWLRPSGKPKTVECRQLLEALAEQGLVSLPAPRSGRPKGSTTRIAMLDPAPTPIEGTLAEVGPVTLERVTTPADHAQWRARMEQYHYLGHRVPFGAHLRYNIESPHGVLGGLQFSSPAWRMKARDQWIGWTDDQRQRGLQHILCNSRFLILPWLRIPNLASHILALAAQRIGADWTETFGVTPWLLETLVDPARYRGVSYRAANWIEAGLTSGRGRDDRTHQRHGATPKQVWLYPLCRDARQRLWEVGS